MNICEWKETSVFPGEYLVSENGNVFSIRANKLLRPAKDKFGYLYYVLCVKGKRITKKAHRLVAEAFIPNPENKPSVDHINGNRTDNRASNLRWATNKENSNNPITRQKLIKSSMKQIPKMIEKSKERNFGRKKVVITYKNGDVITYDSLKKASEATGKCYSKLSMILNGKRNQDKRFVAVWGEDL